MNKLDDFLITRFDIKDLLPEIIEEIYFQGKDTDCDNVINKINNTFIDKTKKENLIKLLDYIKDALYIPNIRYINIVESTLLENKYLIKIINLNCQNEKNIYVLYNQLHFKESYIFNLYYVLNNKKFILQIGKKINKITDYLLVINCFIYTMLYKYKNVDYQYVIDHPYKFIAKLIFSSISNILIGETLSYLYNPYSYIIFMGVLAPLNYKLIREVL